MNNIYIPKPYKIKEIKKEAEQEWLFVVEFDQPCLPGQFVEISIPKVGEAPISITGINDNEIELLIRKVGRVTNVLFELEVGDYLHLRGPYGNSFDFNYYKGKPLLVISGGSGLAPVRPIINTFYQEDNFRLLAGFRDQENILFNKDIKMWKETNKNIHITLDCQGDDSCLVGYVSAHIDMALEGLALEECIVVVVGPPLMMKFTCLELIKKGILEDNLIVSFERNMSCAVGKCGHCKIDETYVCLEGPIFNYTKAKTLLD